MELSNPLVTVIAVCYNHEQFVVECLESIRHQSYPNIQLIIMDDCSKDRSVEIIENWIESHEVNCDFIHHDTNLGLCKTLNEALRIANGKYVSVIATDDFWLPDFILTFVDEIESRSSEYGVVYGNSFMINENGDELPFYRKRLDHHPEGEILYDLVKETFIATNAVVFKREFIEKVGFYDESLFYEDFDMWTKLAEVCRFAYCPKVLAKYRVVQTSMANTKGKEMMGSYLKILSRVVNSHPETYPLVENRKINIAPDLYQINFPKSYKYLFLQYKKNKNVKRLIQSFFAFIGINFENSERALRIISNLQIKKILEELQAL